MSSPDRGTTVRRVAEAIVIGMACLAPWAFGSVDAWAEFGLFAGTALLAFLGTFEGGSTLRARRLSCLPSLGLAGLVLLGLFQAIPLPARVLGWVSPASASLRAELLPRTAERVEGDPFRVVPLPSPRLSQDPDQTIRMVARLAGGWLLFQGVLGLSSGMAGFRLLAIALSANAALLSSFSIVQALTWNGRIFWFRPILFGDAWSVGGPFDHHTHLAEYLNMGLGLALGLAIPGSWRDFLRGGRDRRWAAFAGVVIAAGVIASNSRGGFLAMLGSGVLISLASRVRAVGLGLGAAGLLALVVLMLTVLGGTSPLFDRLASILDPTNDAYTVRIMLCRATLRAWWSCPIWGTGLGSFPEASAPYLDGIGGSFFARAENEYLDLLSEGGLVGVTLMALAAAGVFRLAGRALASSPSPRDRGLILGAIFGVLALGFNSLSDFGPHVAGVGVPAIILIATLCRAGLDAGRPSMSRAGPPRRIVRLGWALYGLATVSAGIGLAYRAFADVRVESCLADAGLPKPGSLLPSMGQFARTLPELERQRSALEAAVQLRPEWSEGHLRLGMIDLILYCRAGNPGRPGSADQDRTVDLLGVHKLVGDGVRRRTGHPTSGDGATRRDLVPAARSFLEARRTCLVSSLAHAELASLVDLLDGADPPSAYLERAFRLAGNRSETLTLAGEVAAGAGDVGLAARCWRRSLEVGPQGWPGVADSASISLTPDQILDEVIPRGWLAFLFAERLYPESRGGLTRRKFLEAAIRKLPDDRDIQPADRLQLEARAWSSLGEPDRARDKMEAALALEPAMFAWRKDYVLWLLRRGQIDEAHEQARIGMYYAPESKPARELLELTADALARREPGR